MRIIEAFPVLESSSVQPMKTVETSKATAINRHYILYIICLNYLSYKLFSNDNK